MPFDHLWFKEFLAFLISPSLRMLNPIQAKSLSADGQKFTFFIQFRIQNSLFLFGCHQLVLGETREA